MFFQRTPAGRCVLVGLDDEPAKFYFPGMKTTKPAVVVLALGLVLSGCEDTNPNGVNISRPSIWSQLFWSPPAPVSPAPIAPETTVPAPQTPGATPPVAPVV